MASRQQKLGALRAAAKFETCFATFLAFAILTATISSATPETYSPASSSYHAAFSPEGVSSARDGSSDASDGASGLMRREIVSSSSHREGESSSRQADVQWSGAIKELSDAAHAVSTALDRVKQAEEVSADRSHASQARLQALLQEELSAERTKERSIGADRAQNAERTELHDREKASLAQAPWSPDTFPSGSEDRTRGVRNDARRDEYRQAEHRYDRHGDAQGGGDYFEERGRDDRLAEQPRRSHDGPGSPTSSSNAGPLNDDHPRSAPPGSLVEDNGHAEGPEDWTEIPASLLQLGAADSDIEYPVMHLEPVHDDGRVLIFEDELEKAELAKAETPGFGRR